MKAIQLLGVLTASVILAACGGGSSNNSFGGGGTASLSASAASSSVTVNPQNFAPDPDSPYTTQVTVRLRSANGTTVADGTSVTLASSNASVGVVSPIDAPSETGASATSTTSSGLAQFWFTAGEQAGTVTLNASATDPASGNNLSASVQITVEPGTSDDDRLSVSGSNTMPTNNQGVPIFFGSPFINELTIEYVGANGQAGTPADGQIGVAISPVTRGAFSTLDDPETTGPDENEFEMLLGSGPVDMTAGVSTIFVHSADQPGPVTVSISLIDANTGEQFSTEFVIEIEDGAADFLPARLDFSVDPQPVYAQSAGGASTKNIQLIVRDSGGNMVPNPEADGVSWNNVRLQLEAPAGSGARLAGTGADGPVNGTDISVRTVNGIVNFALNAGTETGTHRIIATVDRADNNVDQGITDPLQAETSAEVGDGRLFSLELVSPILNAILVNPVVNSIETTFEEDTSTGALVPSDPDGTYSLRVTVQGTDKVGNPVLPGTTVNFGKIDDPMMPGLPRFFVFSGPDGNPEEGGTLFSVLDPPEGFLDDPAAVDDAVEPGDTVALFGKLVPGNREHEAVRFVSNVIDESSVNVTEPFNPNNAIGAPVNDGYVIPWVIGRSRVGNIDQSVVLDDFGRGSVQMTYPINAIGRPIVLWTQGVRVESGGNKTVADVESSRFPGVYPLILTASPSAIRANTDAVVRLCLTDGLRSPIEGTFITGAITEGAANGTLDGDPMTTTTGNPTGTDGAGCVNTIVNVSGIPPEGDPATVTFNVDDAEEPVDVAVVPPGAAMLLVDPSLIRDTSLSTFTRQIDLTLLDGGGSPISGVQLVGECESDGGVLELQVNPGVTDANGETTASVLVGMAGCGTDGGEYPRTGSCTFTTTSGTPEGNLTVLGLDVLTLGTSPPPAGCPAEDDDADLQTLIVQVEDNRPAPQPSSLVETVPAAIACDASSPIGSADCEGEFEAGTTVTLRAPSGTTPVFSGACAQQGGSDPNFGEVAMASESQVCVVTFN